MPHFHAAALPELSFQKLSYKGLGVMDHVYNPSYLGDIRDRRILVQGQPGQKIIKTLSL
jgi:hypothetical protein